MRFKIFDLTLVDIFNKQFINIKNMDYLSDGTVCNMTPPHPPPPPHYRIPKEVVSLTNQVYIVNSFELTTICRTLFERKYFLNDP